MQKNKKASRIKKTKEAIKDNNDSVEIKPILIGKKQNRDRTATKIYVPIIIMAILLLFAIFVPKKEMKGIGYTNSGELHELTEKAVLDEKILANLITVKGVKLGDDIGMAKQKLGNPDFEQGFEPNLLNLEYSSTIDTLGSGLLLHFESGILTRITIAEPFNKYLKDKIKIGSTSEDLYKFFGKPTEITYITESKDSGRAYKKIIFGALGYEFVMDKDKVKFYSFVLPDKVKNKGVVTI